MIVAITGGAGFVGRSLVAEHLARGDTVRVLSRRNVSEFPFPLQVELHSGDLRVDSDSLSHFAQGAHVLYHCAGEIRDPRQMSALHVDGCQRLIRAATGRIGRWVQLSSVGVYGHRSSGVVTEATPCNPLGVYEQTKFVADQIVTEAAERGAFEHSILRPSIVFGPQMTNRSLFQWISMIARGMFCFVGPPGASANYIYVDNVVAALQRCAIDPRANGKTFILSDWRTMEAFVGSIASALRRPTPRVRLPIRPLSAAARLLQSWPRFPLTEARINALSNRTRYACDAIGAELDYRPVVSIEDGLLRTVDRWRELRQKQLL
jgi:nucleoside-diphosphate-sugar epimerase